MQNAPNVRTITATEFKAKCLRLMDEIDETGNELVITKNGHPVWRLAPLSGAAQDIVRHRPGPLRDNRRHHLANRRRMGS